MFGMKAKVLKSVVSILVVFAAIYILFLCSLLIELARLRGRSGEPPQVWALLGGGVIFACPALIASIGLAFTRRLRDTIGTAFSKATNVLLITLPLTVFAHLAIFVWALWSRTTAFSG